MKKIVRSSHLALRFYVHDGWTEEELKPFLLKGEIECTLPDISPYWRLTVYSKLDVESLFKEKVSEVQTYDGKMLTESDALNYMKDLSW